MPRTLDLENFAMTNRSCYQQNSSTVELVYHRNRLWRVFFVSFTVILLHFNGLLQGKYGFACLPPGFLLHLFHRNLWVLVACRIKVVISCSALPVHPTKSVRKTAESWKIMHWDCFWFTTGISSGMGVTGRQCNMVSERCMGFCCCFQLTMNDFSVHRIIGRGGFGEVYGCRKADTGKMWDFSRNSFRHRLRALGCGRSQ